LAESDQKSGIGAHPQAPAESTAFLLTRAREGDAYARDRLIRRYLPVLKSWAHHRLPAYARDLFDTQDLVQITLLRSLEGIAKFEGQGWPLIL